MTYYIPVPPERAGMELDEFLCLSFPLLNKRFLRQQVREGNILVDGISAFPSQHLKTDQVLCVDFDEEEAVQRQIPEKQIQLDVLFEDVDVIAVDKPAGLPVEPDRWKRSKANLIDVLTAMAISRAEEEAVHGGGEVQRVECSFKPRLVHRLDRDTTGVLVAAKNLEAERRLRRAFDEHEVKKSYLALVEGEHPLGDGDWELLDMPIAPDEKKSGRMCVRAEGGKAAQTKICVERRFRGYSLIRCEPLTGRTHQIRVHLREIGFPLAVDPSYGRRKALALSEIKRGYRPKKGRTENPLIDRLTLHAASLEFPDARGEPITVTSQIPADLARVLKQLEKVRPYAGGQGPT